MAATYEPEGWGEAWADEYDDLFPAGVDVEEIGRGLEVHGLDASEAMIERLEDHARWWRHTGQVEESLRVHAQGRGADGCLRSAS